MIVLDTHIWIWWVQESTRLSFEQARIISAHESDVIGISAISFWEVAKLMQLKRIELPLAPDEWFEVAMSYPAASIIPLTPQIAIESTRLPGVFHRDPADEIIVATARVNKCKLVTSDKRILQYPHVETVG